MKPVKAWAYVSRDTGELIRVISWLTTRNEVLECFGIWSNEELIRVEIRELKKRKGEGKA